MIRVRHTSRAQVLSGQRSSGERYNGKYYIWQDWGARSEHGRREVVPQGLLVSMSRMRTCHKCMVQFVMRWRNFDCYHREIEREGHMVGLGVIPYNKGGT